MELGRPKRDLHSVLGLSNARFGSLLMILAAVLLLSVQSVFAQRPTIRTDVAAWIVVYFALEHTLRRGLWMTLFVAYLADVFSGESRGLYVASLVLVFLVLRVIALRFSRVGALGVTVLGVLSTTLAFGIRLILETWAGPGRVTIETWSPAMPAFFLGALLLSYPVYALLAWIESRFQERTELLLGKRGR